MYKIIHVLYRSDITTGVISVTLNAVHLFTPDVLLISWEFQTQPFLHDNDSSLSLGGIAFLNREREISETWQNSLS